MAISPGSDIVLEVAKAADPASYQTAAARLERLAGTMGLQGVAFEEALAGVRPRAPLSSQTPFDPALALVRLQNRHTLADQAAPPPTRPYEKFEAFVLQSFIQSMLPNDGAALYGNGTAGEIWKSMMAEQLGAQLARSGGIGVAEMLAAAHPEGERPAEAGAHEIVKEADG